MDELGEPTSISVAVPCYNYGKFIKEALASVDVQSRQPDEIVIVDDASTDDSWHIVEREVSERPNAKAFRHNQRNGACTTFDDCVRRSTGDLVVILSADDRLSPAYLELSELAILDTDWDFAYCDIHCFGSESTVIRVPEFDAVELGRHNYIHGSAMFRRSMFEQVGGFDSDFEKLGFEDWAFWLAAVTAGAKGGRVPGCWLEYRKHQSGSRNTLGLTAQARARLAAWRRFPQLVARPHPVSFVGRRILDFFQQERV